MRARTMLVMMMMVLFLQKNGGGGMQHGWSEMRRCDGQRLLCDDRLLRD